MLKFKHMIEFAASMDRTHFLSAVRKRAAEVMEIRKHQPGWTFNFTPAPSSTKTSRPGVKNMPAQSKPKAKKHSSARLADLLQRRDPVCGFIYGQ
jgi:hypothetical protein